MMAAGRARLAFGCAAALALLALAGCGGQRQPVIPRAAFTERDDHREAVEGRDTTFARVVYPEFVGARTPEALDSLRAMVHALLVAPAGSRPAPAGSVAGLLDGFISEWNETRKATRSHAYWRFERRIEVVAETLGVVTLAASEFAYTGGAHSMSTRRYVMIGADDGRTLGFAALFDSTQREALGAAIEPQFRAARKLNPDSSLASAGFTFAGGRFAVNENFGIARDGIHWHFDPYEIAAYAAGPTDLIVPYALVKPFVRRDGPLGKLR